MKLLAHSIACILGVLLLGPAVAQTKTELVVLESRSFTHELLNREVRTELSVAVERQLLDTHEGLLHIDIRTAFPGQPADTERAALINGFIGIACPPGVKPLAQPRPYWRNPQSGEYEFMYSRALPELEALEGRRHLMDEAVAGGPQQMYSALAQISEALDPTVQPVGPANPLLSGSDPAYTIGGVTWLIPVTVSFETLVSLFEEEPGLTTSSALRISVHLRIDEDVTDPRIIIYAGGLSTGMRKVALLPQDIPATAIPLEPLPAVIAPATEDAAAPPEETANAPLIPTLLLGYEWVTWEGELALAEDESKSTIDDRHEDYRLVETPKKPDATADDTPDSGGSTAVEPPAEDAEGAEDFFVPRKSDEGDSIDVGAPNEEVVEAESDSDPSEVETDSEPAEDEEVAEAVEDVENAAPSESESESISVGEPGDNSDSIATAVEPGTIPEFDSEYVVPLKPITNLSTSGSAGAAGRQPISSGMLGGPPVYTAPPDLGDMILIPEGYFLLGTGESAQDSEDDEHPQQQLFLPAFFIDKYLVTNRQFYEFALASGYKPEGNWERHFSPATADLPVRGISWNDANSYARWAGKRLPTEVEWEKAMRGEDGRTYPWGEDWSASILPRGEFNYDVVIAEDAASPYGLMSTVGVLWQWTASSFAMYPYDPQANSQYKVLRGGCFSNGRNVVRCANRYSEPANVALNTFGFRCAKDAP